MQGDRNKPVISARLETEAPAGYDLTGTYLEFDASQGPSAGRPTNDDPASRRRAKVRQAGLLVLMIVAASLIFVLPEAQDEGYALDAEADQRSLARYDADAAAPAVGRFDIPKGGSESPEIAFPAADDPDGDAGEAAESMSAALADQALARRAEEALLLFAQQATTTTTTPAPTTTTVPEPPPSTAGLEEATSQDTTETTPPSSTETSSDQSTADGSNADEIDSTTTEDSDSLAVATSPTDAPEEGTSSTEASVPDAGSPDTTIADVGSETTDPPETSVPQETTPPATEPPAPAEGTWVDTGNGVLVPKELIAIRYCESRDNYTAANPSSSARGAYQFLTGSWAAYGHKERYGVNQAHLATPSQQDEAALLTWQRDGTRPWNASKSCWSKRL